MVDKMGKTAEEVMEECIKETREELPFTLRVSDVSILLDCSRKKVRSLLSEGEIPARKLGNRWVINKDQFLLWYYGRDKEWA